MSAPFDQCRPARTRAFTLVELLVVMGVIVILMSLLVPTLNAIREQMNVAKTVTIIHGISMGLDAYKSIHNVFPPDKGLSTHAQLNLTAECLVYYLSGASIAYDPNNPPPGYKWRHALFQDTTGSGRKATTIYYEFHGDSLVDFDNDNIPEVIDPWQNQLIYNTGTSTDGNSNQNKQPRHRIGEYDIYAPGPDRKPGTKDDVTNWKDSVTYPEYANPVGWIGSK